jgi:Glucodextranase, domain B/Periplasmic copper-binding protein (NosD)
MTPLSKTRRMLPCLLVAVVILTPLLIWLRSVGNPLDYFTHEMPPGQAIFIFAKLAGLLAMALFWLQAMLAMLQRLPSLRDIFPIRSHHHYFLGITTALLIGVHVGLFVVASSLRKKVVAIDLLLPNFDHGYYFSAISYGVLALYLLLMVLFAARQVRRGAVAWKKVHMLWAAVFALALLHSLSIGSETRYGILSYWFFFIASSLALLIIIRLWFASRSVRSTPRIIDTDTVPHSGVMNEFPQETSMPSIKTASSRIFNRLAKMPRRWMALSLFLGAPMVIAAAVQLSKPDILLYPLPSTVYELEFPLTGLADPRQTLQVEINGDVVALTTSNQSGDFVVTIQPVVGINRIRVSEVGKKMLADESETYQFRYAPVLQSVQNNPNAKASLQAVNAVSSTTAPIQIVKAISTPAITVPAATSATNPLTLSGTAAASSTVSFYVNGRFTRSASATASGTFSSWVPLEDGNNAIYVTATNTLGETSVASNTVQVSYTHNVPRTQTGTIAQNTVWTKGDGTAYSLTGDLTISPGVTLWIQPGALVTAAANYQIISQGNLVVRGTGSARAVLKSASTNCNGTNTARQDWKGIEVPAGGFADVDYVEIQCAAHGIFLNGGSGTIRHAWMLNNYIGLRTEAATAATKIMPDVYAENEFRGNGYGILIKKNSTPLITGNNLITANSNGIEVDGITNAAQDPNPVVTGNRIFSNSSHNFYATYFANPSTTILNAQGNWWGTTDHGAIAASIYDWSNNPIDSPIVDFRGYLGAIGGTAFFTGTSLNGPITANQTLSSGNVQALGSVIVNPGVTLTINSGAQLSFPLNTKLQVNGSLVIAGTSGARATLKPTAATCNGTATQRSDWGGVEVLAGGTATIDYADIQCAARAVYFNSGTGTIRNTKLLNNNTGIDMIAVAPARITPQITTANEIRGNFNGVYIRQNTSPSITGGNIIIANAYAIQIQGNSAATQNPLPVITGNTFQLTTNKNIEANDFHDPQNTRINATGNWWATIDPSVISRSIVDWSESDYSPVVDYSGYLTAAGGTSAWTGPTLNGPIKVNQTLAGVNHLMLGRVSVEPGVTLTISAGANISIVEKFRWTIKGTMNVNGTSASRAVFKPTIPDCTAAASQRNDWTGFEYLVGSVGTINYADIYCATTGVYFYQAGTLKNSLLYANYTGINMAGASSTAKIAPLIQGNEIRNGYYGIYVRKDASPTINTNNVITGNEYGIYAYNDSFSAGSNPAPAVGGNSIYGNRLYNYRADYFTDPLNTILNARGNWWGTADPALISATIYDNKNTTSSPYVDFGSYLGAAGGTSAFSGTTLIGPIAANRTLTSGQYQIFSDIPVSTGVTLTVNPGAVLNFVPGRRLKISGSLIANGTSTNRIVFGSAGMFPKKGDWFGLEVMPGAIANLDYVRLQHSTYGVNFAGGQGSVKHSLIRFNTQGITVEPKSNPTISTGNEITLNDYGVVVVGNLVAADNPAPVITGNNLYGNTIYNLSATGFANATTTTLNATGNWWNLTGATAINATIRPPSNTPTIDIGTPLTAATGPLAMVLSGVSVTVPKIQPLNSAAPAQGVFTISRAGTVITQIRRQSDNVVVYQYTQTFAAPGSYSFVWNGKDNAAVIVPAGMYRAAFIASDGVDPFVFDTEAQVGVAVSSGSGVPATYRPYRNEFYKANVALSAPGLVTMEVTPQGGTTFKPFTNVYYPAGLNWVYWDGRDPSGNIITVPVDILVSDSTYVPITAIQVLIASPTITGLTAAPDIEVKADPYLVQHSFEQVTRMAYRLSDESYVRFALLPPGINNIRDPAAIALLDNQLQAANTTFTVEWLGYNPATPSKILVAPEGAYTFAIEAKSSATNQTTLYRGVVNIRQ